MAQAHVTVRAVQQDDFDRVTSLLEVLGRPAVGPAERSRCQAVWREQLADPGAEHLVAELDGGVAGFCSLHYRARLNHSSLEAWIPDLIVDPGARRRGVAAALLAEAERRARARGCHGITLESGHQREAAHALYAAAGIPETGKQFWKRLG